MINKDLSGTRTIAADIETVWAHLNTAATLQSCIPGCETLDGTPLDGFHATVTQKVGPVKATFKGAVTLENIERPHSYTIVGEGKGGVAGFAKGRADVALKSVPEGTELTYAVEICEAVMVEGNTPTTAAIPPSSD